MDQDKVVNKIMYWILVDGIIQPEHQNKVRGYLDQVYAAGYDCRTHELSAKRFRKVIQYDKKGNSVAQFDSIKSAALANKVSRCTVDDSVTGKVPLTRKGFYFRYADDGNT
jgi:hypothetical protein